MAAAPSRGRTRPMDRSTTSSGGEKKTFVFGSSTPRDLSYMDSVPATLRAYDSKVKPAPRAKNETLAHYMRQARSVTRNQSGL
ncbi:unnamed protein product [Gongylonema pulchrum]|uniref:UL3.5 n=1 Tax=Gongylonema pulchrum TaxID=637853 RepID=A0A183D3X2_9BILA|nr:unnamed protein product [Gongylonema pulchrum]